MNSATRDRLHGRASILKKGPDGSVTQCLAVAVWRQIPDSEFAEPVVTCVSHRRPFWNQASGARGLSVSPSVYSCAANLFLSACFGLFATYSASAHAQSLRGAEPGSRTPASTVTSRAPGTARARRSTRARTGLALRAGSSSSSTSAASRRVRPSRARSSISTARAFPVRLRRLKRCTRFTSRTAGAKG